jgi:triacylglycerol lipase
MVARGSVLLVHGLWNTPNIFWRLRSHLESHHWQVYAPSLTPNNGDLGIDSLAHQLQAYIAELAIEDRFALVGFSMGGLVSRYYLQHLEGTHRVHRFVSVATPHYGSAMAFFRWNPGGRQMQPGSRFLASLNQNLHKLHPVQPVDVWTPFDALVVPASSCRLPIGQGVCLPVSSHNNLLRDERSLNAIAQALND